MRPRHDLRRPQFDRGILWEVENFDEFKLRAEDVIGILMPALVGLRTLDSVIAHDHR